MSLFDQPPAPISPESALHASLRFVEQCRTWAVAEIARRKADGRDAREWESYLRFTDHTLRELRNGTLDAWFTATD